MPKLFTSHHFAMSRAESNQLNRATSYKRARMCYLFFYFFCSLLTTEESQISATQNSALHAHAVASFPM